MQQAQAILSQLGIEKDNPGVFDGNWFGSGDAIEVRTPIDGSVLATVRQANTDEFDRAVAKSHEAFLKWRTIPAPIRGETIRRLGVALREYKEVLGDLVTLEMGKIQPEGHGEVQEMNYDMHRMARPARTLNNMFPMMP